MKNQYIIMSEEKIEKLCARCNSERTATLYSYAIRKFYEWNPHAELSQKDAEDFVEYLKMQGYESQTINVACAALKKMAKIEGKSLFITNTPKIVQKTPKILTEEEVSFLLDNVGKR